MLCRLKCFEEHYSGQLRIWMAKFNRADDHWNDTRVEHAMLRLARESGITAAESRIETVGGKEILVEELRRIVEDAKRDARELFRRDCFNALI